TQTVFPPNPPTLGAMTTCAVCGYQAAEPFKFCPECGAPAVPSGQAQRKVVTVLFCDVTGSTALGESIDPEAFRAVLARYFERMIGAPTLELVKGAVEVDPLEPLEVKGKSEHVQAYRLKSVHEVPERRPTSPMVGRAAELAQLGAAFERTVADRSCELFTVVG